MKEVPEVRIAFVPQASSNTTQYQLNRQDFTQIQKETQQFLYQIQQKSIIDHIKQLEDQITSLQKANPGQFQQQFKILEQKLTNVSQIKSPQSAFETYQLKLASKATEAKQMLTQKLQSQVVEVKPFTPRRFDVQNDNQLDFIQQLVNIIQNGQIFKQLVDKLQPLVDDNEVFKQQNELYEKLKSFEQLIDDVDQKCGEVLDNK